MMVEAFDIRQFVLAHLWHLIVGIICIVSFLFGYRKAATVWGLLFLLLVAVPFLKQAGVILRRMF